MLRSMLRPESFADRLWRRFSREWPAVLSVLLLVVLFFVAAVAPFLSQDRPIWIIGSKGEGHSPLLQSFAKLDWFWLGLLASTVAGLLSWRILPTKRRSMALTGGLVVAIMTVFLYLAVTSKPHHERRRYLTESIERQTLLNFDRKLSAEEQSTDALIDEGIELTNELGGSQAVTLAFFERFGLMAKGPEGRAQLRSLAAENIAELDRLKNAVYPPNRFDPNLPGRDSLVTPGEAGHVLGCDQQGRDVLARLIFGTRTALTVALGAVFLIAILGLCFGLIGGYFGGILDQGTSRITEVVLCLPALAILVAAPAWVPREWRDNQALMVVFLGLILWPQAARLVRNEVQRNKHKDHVRSAIALGLGHRQVILRHVLPGCVPPLLVSLGLTAGNLILLESSLSFLGLGPEDRASWGRMLAEAREAALLGNAWHLAIFPGLAVVICMLTFNMISQNFERALNPRR